MAIENFKSANSSYWAIERNYYRNSGLIGLPLAGLPSADNPTTPGTSMPCRIVRLHGPIEALIVRWACVMEGTAPNVPNPYLFDANLIFKKGRRSAAIPCTLAGYAGHSWSMSGWAEYMLASTIDLNSDMPTGVQPWDLDPNTGKLRIVTDMTIPAVKFVNTILEAQKYGTL